MNVALKEREDSDIDEEDNWEEMEESDQEVDCLFCATAFDSFPTVLEHCSKIHNVDFINMKNKFQMDCYSFIKLVNFIRKTSPLPEDLIKITVPAWNDEQYLKPIKESDPWLMFDLEDYFEQSRFNPDSTVVSNGHLPEDETVSELRAKLVQKEEEVCVLKTQIDVMKACVHKILLDDASDGKTNSKSLSIDNPYFDSYSSAGIHHEMLSDSVRTKSYKDAIFKNDSVFAQKTVLDLGCGTGILSMFVASTSAQKIYAVDNSDIVCYAIEIIKENNLESKINVIKSRIEDDHVELESVDIIVSEWMGYFLLFEGMLDSLIFARDRYLKPGGLLVPDACNLFMCGADDSDGYKNYVGFWSDVYGYRMSSIRREVIKEAAVDVISADKIVTSEALISSFNLYTCTVADTSFSSSFELVCSKDATITTLVGYFDVNFNLQNHVHFSTGPFATPTHWKQTLFFIPEPISRKKDSAYNMFTTLTREADGPLNEPEFHDHVRKIPNLVQVTLILFYGCVASSFRKFEVAVCECTTPFASEIDSIRPRYILQ